MSAALPSTVTSTIRYNVVPQNHKSVFLPFDCSRPPQKTTSEKTKRSCKNKQSVL